MKLFDLERIKESLSYGIFRVKVFVDNLLNLRIEIMLTAFSGLLSFLTAAMCYRSSHLHSVRLVAIGRSNVDVIAFSCFLFIILGLAGFFLAFAKLSRKLNFTFNKLLMYVALMLLVNFFVALILSEFKAKVMEGVDVGMMEQLRTSVLWRRRNVSASAPKLKSSYLEVVSAWDTIQYKLSCCGVYSYRDYIPLYPKATKVDRIIPVTCCSLKNVASLASLEGVKQCYIDVTIEAVSSQFLHTQGCQGPVQRWLVHLINKITYLIYITSCFQGFTVLYLSYFGYKDILSNISEEGSLKYRKDGRHTGSNVSQFSFLHQ